MDKQQEHWEKVYQTKSPDAVSWFQEHASLSLEIIRSVGETSDAQIIDVGSGASTLLDDLLTDGFNFTCGTRQRSGPLSSIRMRWGLMYGLPA